MTWFFTRHHLPQSPLSITSRAFNSKLKSHPLKNSYPSSDCLLTLVIITRAGPMDRGQSSPSTSYLSNDSVLIVAVSVGEGLKSLEPNCCLGGDLNRDLSDSQATRPLQTHASLISTRK